MATTPEGHQLARRLRRARRVTRVAAAMGFAFAADAPAVAMEGMDAILGGGMGGAPSVFKIELAYGATSDADLAGQPGEIGLTRYGVSASDRFYNNGRDALKLSLRDERLDLDGAAILPASGAPVPDELRKVGLGLSWSRKLGGGRMFAAGMNVGSASDDPFGPSDRTAFTWTASYVKPTPEGNAWIVAAFMTNMMEDLNYVPIPAVAYMSRGERHMAVIGLPFAMVSLRPTERWEFDLSYFPVTTFRAKAIYRPAKPVGIYARLESSHDTYFRAARALDDERLYFFGMRASLGVKAYLGRHASVDVSGGWDFDRFVFEGEDWSDRDADRVDIGNAFAFKLTASMFW